MIMNFDVKEWLEEKNGEATLLGVCPMSEEIVKAAIKEAEETGFIPMFIATPRQVDADRGYTRWSQKELKDFISETANEFGYEGPYILARDHGGPYQSTRDRGDPEVSLEEAMGYAKEMFAEDVRAGFDIIHVDATEDSTTEGPLYLEEVTRRTTELMEHIEEVKEEKGLPESYYEVGTEEIVGGMTEPDDFERFIKLLSSQLEDEGLGEVMDKIIFIVGQVGTTMRIDMANKFNSDQATTLVDIASDHGLFIKVHYTDWLNNSTLERFPEIGIGAANVGPEFAASIVEVLDEMEEKEVEALKETGSETEASDFMNTLKDAAIKEAPWKKFSPEDLGAKELEEFAEENRRDIAVCVGRYVMNNPGVKKSRKKLYDNLKKHTSIDDPDRLVTEGVKNAIDRYVKSFNVTA